MTSPSEAWLCYPGIKAIAVYRFAHELHLGQARVLARMLAEMAHSETGIDIHPGAKIGARCFIDHGTGVVIGETAKIGDGCRLYQQVTLGGDLCRADADGRVLRGSEQRHPTLGRRRGGIRRAPFWGETLWWDADVWWVAVCS